MTPDERMANLKAAFATNNAPWDDRTEAALRSVIAAQGLEVAHWQMPEEVARGAGRALRAVASAYPSWSAALAWLDERYDEQGRVR